MKNIYIRAGLSPLDNMHPAKMLLDNAIGENVGNLVYAYSIFRALMVDDDTRITPNYYKVRPDDADKINEKYDAFIIPLADAFRPQFMGELRNLTSLIKRLTIPCVVTGVGLRAPFETEIDKNFGYEFDNDVKAFVRAVLDKSAMIGVRGQLTADYLSSLGFKEGRHHTVIGCPSMYTFGRELKIRETNLTPESRVCVNNNVLCPESVQDFLERSMKAIPDHYYLPQRLPEFRLVYTGAPYVHSQELENFPCRMTDRLYREDRVRFFVNIPTWLDFLRQADLSFGCRLHGNVAATIAGTPSLFVPHDARMRELVDYHNFPHIWAKDINEKTDIFDLFAKTDFQSVTRGHAQRFDHYIDFLDANGLDHIYKNGADPEEAPLDRKMKEIHLHPMIKTISGISFEEMTERFDAYYPREYKKINKLRNEVKKLRAENAELKAAAARKEEPGSFFAGKFKNIFKR